jgi:hypothetical protein
MMRSFWFGIAVSSILGSASQRLRGLTPSSVTEAQHDEMIEQSISMVLTNQRLPGFSMEDQRLDEYGFDITISGIKCDGADIGALDVTAKWRSSPPNPAQELNRPVNSQTNRTLHLDPPENKLPELADDSSLPTDKSLTNEHALSEHTPKTTPAIHLQLHASGISLTCSAKYRYKLSFWPYYPRGGGDVKLSVGGTSQLKAKMKLHGLHDSTGTEPVTMEMLTDTCEGHVDVVDPSVKFSSSLTSGLLNQFKGHVSGLVEKFAQPQLCSAVGRELEGVDTATFANELSMLKILSSMAV